MRSAKIRRIVLIVSAALAFSAVALIGGIYLWNYKIIKDTLESLKKAATYNLQDPDSARFRSLRLQSMEGTVAQRLQYVDFALLKEAPPEEVLSFFKQLFTYDPDLMTLCGEVNAKNAFGAYVGYRPFYVGVGSRDKPRRNAFIGEAGTDTFVKTICDIGGKSVVLSEE